MHRPSLRAALTALALLVPQAPHLAAQTSDTLILEGPALITIDRVLGTVDLAFRPAASFLDLGLQGEVAFATEPVGTIRLLTPSGNQDFDLAPAVPAGLCFDRLGRLFVLDDAGVLYLRQGNSLVASGRLPVVAGRSYEQLRAALDGTLWTIARGPHADEIVAIDPANVPASASFGPFPGFVSIGGLCFASASGHPLQGVERQFLVSPDSPDLLELDSGVLVDTIDLGALAPGFVQALLGPQGLLYCVSTDGQLVQIDLSTRVSSLVETPFPVDSAGVDNEGVVWISGPRSLQTDQVLPLGGEARERIATAPDLLLDRASFGFGAGHLFAGFDRDGDGARDGDEFFVGSNPIDPQSRPELDLDLGPYARPGTFVPLELRGDPAPAIVAFAIEPGANQPIPGFQDLLQLQAPILASVPLNVPGRLDLQLDIDVFEARVSAQALALSMSPTMGSTARLSDAESVRWSRAFRQTIRERFDDLSTRDSLRSSGNWGGNSASPAQIGGSGELGSFDPTLGVEVLPGIFEFDTDGTTFPGSVTANGQPIVVDDGVFEFTDFTLPVDTTVRFRGSHRVVIRVTGSVFINGTIDVSGDDVPGFVGVNNVSTSARLPVDGQEPGVAGPGGGAGGRGGDSADGLTSQPSNDGQRGAAFAASPNSGYAQFPLAGGAGSEIWPPNGLVLPSMFTAQFGATSLFSSTGGGGGSLLTAGTEGAYVSATDPSGTGPQFGPIAAPGIAPGFLMPPAGVSSLEHFAVGGTGGGGGGAGLMGVQRARGLPPDGQLTAGAAGAGGGGALVLRAGGDLLLGPFARLRSRGGNAFEGLTFSVNTSLGSFPVPGGGGSGGTVLLQSGGVLLQLGEIDVRGGSGGFMQYLNTFFRIEQLFGGDGGSGFVRVESVHPLSLAEAGVVLGPTALPQGTVGPLTDVDDETLIMSRFRRLDGRVPVGYTVRGFANGVGFAFSDGGAFPPANQPGQPVRVFLQGRGTSPQGELVVGPRRELTSELVLDPLDEYRFVIVFDQTVATDTVVTEFELNVLL